MTQPAIHAERPAVIVNPADTLLEAQRDVLESIVRGRPLPEVLAALCRIVESQAERTVRAAILLVDSTGTRLSTGAAPSLPDAYNRAIDGIEIAPDVGTCCAAAARGEVVVTRHIATDPGWTLLKHLPLELGLHAAWSMPILSSSGRVLGTFGTYFPEAREPIAHERTLIEVLARTAALAIERQQADEAMDVSTSRHRFLAELAAATQPLLEAADVMATTARLLAEHLGVDRCAYAEVEDEQVFIITGDYARQVPSIVGRWPVAAFGPGCVADMLAGTAYVVEDTDTHREIGPEHLPAYRATNIRAVVCVPLHKDGRFTAAMAVHQTYPRRWTRAEIDLVELVVARCWEALERARVTRNLRNSEARYRAMVEASPECVKLVAADGTLLQMNASGLRMIEALDEHAVIGQCVYPVIAPEYRDAFRAFNERICRGDSGTLEFELIGLKGTRRSMETTAVPLPAAPGQFMQLAVTRDVTARVAADRALAESRARVDYAVRLSGVGFWYCDLPFDELLWDARVKEHFFLPLDARVTIELFYERIHPEDRESTREAIESSIRDHISYDVVYRTVEPTSGQIKWIRALGGTAYGADGTPVHFDGVTVDFTAQKLDQERLARLLEREQEHGRLLKQVADAALTIHASESLESVLQVVTEEARHILGAHFAVTTLAAHDEQTQPIRTVACSDRYRASGKTDLPPGTVEIHASVCRENRPMRTARSEPGSGSGDRQEALHGWIAVPLVARNGSNLGVLQLRDKYEGEFSDIDQAVLIQLAQIAAVALENARLYHQLREQDRRKDEFLATLAHELRNPLAPIRTGVQVLQLSSSAEQARKTRQMMERQLGHLVRMVDDLLDISRITLGKLVLKKESVDFRSVLHSALETTRPLIEASGHELALRLPKDPLPLEVDPTRLAQVIANLLNNSAKYTPAGGRIQLTAQVDDGQLTVRVSDTGIGIPADMVVRVFDMFTQVGRSMDRAQGGLGIGLTLVRRLVEMHGGSIDAESPGVGMGSTFTIRLPLTKTAAAASLLPTAAADVAGPSLKILVVDDNVDAAESLGMLLELSGHQTRLAYSGPEALIAAREFAPHAVLLDIGLPGLNGYEVAQRLRAEAAVPPPLLVALTGWGTEDDRRRTQAAGFDRHLVKPVDMDKLIEVLAAAPTGRMNGQ
jgi:PAS domain S-box-containing protein